MKNYAKRLRKELTHPSCKDIHDGLCAVPNKDIESKLKNASIKDEGAVSSLTYIMDIGSIYELLDSRFTEVLNERLTNKKYRRIKLIIKEFHEAYVGLMPRVVGLPVAAYSHEMEIAIYLADRMNNSLNYIGNSSEVDSVERVEIWNNYKKLLIRQKEVKEENLEILSSSISNLCNDREIIELIKEYGLSLQKLYINLDEEIQEIHNRTLEMVINKGGVQILEYVAASLNMAKAIERLELKEETKQSYLRLTI